MKGEGLEKCLPAIVGHAPGAGKSGDLNSSEPAKLTTIRLEGKISHLALTLGPGNCIVCEPKIR